MQLQKITTVLGGRKIEMPVADWLMKMEDYHNVESAIRSGMRDLKYNLKSPWEGSPDLKEARRRLTWYMRTDNGLFYEEVEVRNSWREESEDGRRMSTMSTRQIVKRFVDDLFQKELEELAAMVDSEKAAWEAADVDTWAEETVKALSQAFQGFWAENVRYTDFSGSQRRATWVIKKNGDIRESVYTPPLVHGKPRGYAIKAAAKTDLVVRWEKPTIGGAHVFEVLRSPTVVSHQQVETTAKIEREIQAAYRDAAGISGKRSEDVKEGWGLSGQNLIRVPTPEEIAAQEEEDRRVNGPINNPFGALASLLKK